MIQKIFLFGFITVYSGLLLLNAQSPEHVIAHETDSSRSVNDFDAEEALNSPFSLQTGIGTSFGFAPGLGALTRIYISPSVRYSLTPRTVFHAGIAATYGIPSTPYAPDQMIGSTQSLYTAYFSGSYLLNENLTIHGTAEKGILHAPFLGNKEFIEVHDFSIGATYDFGSFSIGATLHRSNTPLYRTPFGYGQPFYGY